MACLALAGLLSPSALYAQLATGTVDFTVDDLYDKEQVTISLSDNSNLVLLRDYVVEDAPGKYSWIGFVQDDVNGRAFITVNAPNAVGSIQTSTKLYELAITQVAADPIQEIDPLTLPPEAEPILPPIFSDGFEGEVQAAAVQSATAACDDTPAAIDVMVLYSDDAASASADIETEIRNAISMANTDFLDSHIQPGEPGGIKLGLNVVHTQMLQVNENTPVTSDQLLEDLRTGRYEFSTVPGLRNQYAADLVILILEKGDNCGQAHMSHWKGNGFEKYGYGYVNRDCIKQHTFTHEVGHLFGAHHDKYAILNNNSPLPDPSGSNYGYSHIGPVTAWRTIMAYENECAYSGFTYCPRPGFFSSPDFFHAGTPTGIAGTDNRKQLIEAAPALACYRTRPKLLVQKVNQADGTPTTQGLVQSSQGTVNPTIDCGSQCSGNAAAGTTVQLTAQSSGGWTFARWSPSGVCPGSTNSQCQVALIGDKTAIAEFAPPVTLTVQRQGAGGMVQSTSGNIIPAIDCGLLCQGTAVAGTQVQLTAKHSPPWMFVRWDQGGACGGSTSRTCNVTLNSNQTAVAVFAETDPLPLSLSGHQHSCYLEVPYQVKECNLDPDPESGFLSFSERLSFDTFVPPEQGGGYAYVNVSGQISVTPGQSSISAVLDSEATGQWGSWGSQFIRASYGTNVQVASNTLSHGTPVTVRVTFGVSLQHSLEVELLEPPIVQWLAPGPRFWASLQVNGLPAEVWLDGAAVGESVDFMITSSVGSSIGVSAGLIAQILDTLAVRAKLKVTLNGSISGPYLTEVNGLDVNFIQN